jgi:Domain of unknown function (DUF397).
MVRPDFSKAKWRKSNGSSDSGCVEVAYADGAIGVRDTKDHGSGPILIFNEHEWTAFLGGVHAGEFDLNELKG